MSCRCRRRPSASSSSQRASRGQLLEQRLVHELDRGVVGDEQPFAHERREHALDTRVVLGVELGACHPPSRRRLVVAARGDEPQQDPAPGVAVLVGQRPKCRLRMPRDRAPDAAGLLVRSERQRPAVAAQPEVDERGREQRQAAGLAGDVVDERVDQRRLDVEPCALRGALDRPAQLGSASAGRAGRGSGRRDPPAPRGVRGARRSPRAGRAGRQRGARDPRPRRRARRRTPAARRRRWTVRRAPRADRPRGRAARRDARARAAATSSAAVRSPGRTSSQLASERREQAGAEQRRLAAARRADEREQRRVRQACDELLDEPLAAEEELGVRRFERRQALVRADVAESRGAGALRAGRRRGSAPGPA